MAFDWFSLYTVFTLFVTVCSKETLLTNRNITVFKKYLFYKVPIYICSYIYEWAHMHSCLYVCVCIYADIYIYIYVYVYIYIYIYIYM